MGALLSRMLPMELRRVEGARAEPYNVLLEAEAKLRSQRALKREVYFMRAAVIGLVLLLVLVLGLGVCLLFYMQFPACKDKGHGGRASGDQDHQQSRSQLAAQDSDLTQPHFAFQNGNEGYQQHDVSVPKPPPSAYLKPADSTNSAQGKGNITWKEQQDCLTGFSLQDSESLVVPEFGTYRISLQVTYRNNGDKENGEEQIFHKVVVYQKGYHNLPRIVLEVFEFVYWNKKPRWIKTTYSEDETRLDSGDIIRVESSHLGFIRGVATFLNVRHKPTG